MGRRGRAYGVSSPRIERLQLRAIIDTCRAELKKGNRSSSQQIAIFKRARWAEKQLRQLGEAPGRSGNSDAPIADFLPGPEAVPEAEGSDVAIAEFLNPKPPEGMPAATPPALTTKIESPSATAAAGVEVCELCLIPRERCEHGVRDAGVEILFTEVDR